MKILLCASKTPDTTSKISFSPDSKSLATQGITFILNPYDDHALAKAVDLKDKFPGSTLTVIHVGDASAKAVLDRCLAIGADDVIRIDHNPEDAYTVASLIASAIQDKNYDLILTGRESIDFNGSQVCDLLGEMLGMTSISFATDLQIEGSNVKLSRFIDGGEETLQVQLPIIISATKELAEPKIPNMRGIMAARSKPNTVVNPSDLANLVQLVKFEAPVQKSGCQFIDASEAEKLIEILHSERKLI